MSSQAAGVQRLFFDSPRQRTAHYSLFEQQTTPPTPPKSMFSILPLVHPSHFRSSRAGPTAAPLAQGGCAQPTAGTPPGSELADSSAPPEQPPQPSPQQPPQQQHGGAGTGLLMGAVLAISGGGLGGARKGAWQQFAFPPSVGIMHLSALPSSRSPPPSRRLRRRQTSLLPAGSRNVWAAQRQRAAAHPAAARIGFSGLGITLPLAAGD